MNKPVSAVVIIGCGYIGSKTAEKYLEQNLPVSALVRSQSSALKLQQQGIRVDRLDLAQSVNLSIDTANTLLFHFLPPPATGQLDTHTRHLLEALSSAPPARIVYISTTGVYGNCDGQWVTEDHPVNPEVDRARRRLDAEQQLLAWGQQQQVDTMILRTAGIYGPGKLPLQRLQQGLPVIRKSESPFTNRIHADDLVTLAMAIMERGQHGHIYHGCDGQPGTMSEYFSEIARYSGLPAPTEISLEEGKQQLSAGMMSYMRESRRLSNEKTLRELGVRLRYPSLQSGLEQCFSQPG